LSPAGLNPKTLARRTVRSSLLRGRNPTVKSAKSATCLQGQETRRPFSKVSFVRRIGDIYCGVGYYKK